ncbi:MAG: DUF1552 domain-containing protein [Sandaracinus sp.]
MKLSRRDLLRTLGVGAAAAAMPMIFTGSRARAGGPTIPKRIVFLYVQSGSMPGRWEPQIRAGAPASTSTEWDVNTDLHGDLAPYRADLNYFENLDFLSEYDDPTDPANSHIQGGTHAMSAAHRIDARTVGGPTIDQIIAAGINAGGPVTLLPSLEIAYGASPESSVSATGPSGILPRLEDPGEVYDRCFPGGAVDDTTHQAEVRRRGEVFSFLRGRYGALTPRLTGADRRKIEQQRDTLNDLEARLALGDGSTATPPDRSILDPLGAVTPDTRYATYTDLDMKLVAAALHNDVTRVVSIELQDAPDVECGFSPTRFTDASMGGMPITDTHGLIHAVMNPSHPLSSDPAAVEVIRQQHLATTRRARLLLDELAMRTESDGQRLLDHTVVLFCSQIADGSHCLQGMPWYTVGRCGGALRTGQWFRNTRTSGDPLRWISPRWSGRGQSHADLFTSLANAMGVSVTSVGAPSANSGGIRALLA